jgi:hypothetical protein
MVKSMELLVFGQNFSAKLLKRPIHVETLKQVPSQMFKGLKKHEGKHLCLPKFDSRTPVLSPLLKVC